MSRPACFQPQKEAFSAEEYEIREYASCEGFRRAFARFRIAKERGSFGGCIAAICLDGVAAGVDTVPAGESGNNGRSRARDRCSNRLKTVTSPWGGFGDD